MNFLDVVDFTYPKKEGDVVIYKKYRCLVIHPFFNNNSHMLELNDLDQNLIKRIVAFIHADKYRDEVKKDPMVTNLLSKYNKGKAKWAPLEFYRLFIKPLLAAYNLDIYRLFNRNLIRGLKKVKLKDIMGK